MHDDQVLVAIEKAREQYSRIDDSVDGLNWVLARKPESGSRIGILDVDGNDTVVYVYVQHHRDLSGIPFIRVVYSYDENQVVIHALEAS